MPFRRASALDAQHGQAFLLLIITLAFGAAAIFYGLYTPANPEIERDRKTADALAQARDALLGYAAADATRPGQLPCPDTTNDGFADSCAAVGSATSVRIGRLPWKSLKIPELRDGSGELLWYAVSRNFAATSVINSDTVSEYAVTGVSPAANVVAVVFAPGPIVGAQLRDAASSPCVTTGTTIARNRCAANYLEGGNDDGDATFVTALPAAAFNDRLLAITHDMLMSRVLQRVAYHARKVLLSYYGTNGFFPTASAYADATGLCTTAAYEGRFPLPPTAVTGTGLCTDTTTWSGANLETWFRNNNWNRYMLYAVSPACTAAASAAICTVGGSLTVSGRTSNVRALLIATGRAFPGQSRPCISTADCLEDAENINGDATFVFPTPSSTNNDQLFIVSP